MNKSTSLDHVMSEESTRLMGSLAVHHALKENGNMQATNQIIGSSVTKELADVKALEEFRAATGIEDANLDGTQPPQKALTKKQQKAAKYAQKNLMKQLRGMQRQGQAQHIMGRLFQHSIRTPEQARQIHAHDRAKKELTELLGERQARAFFAANADTRCHDFFPKATIEMNPKLMTAANGESRTLAQVFEYFIYKHFQILSKEAEVLTPAATELNLSIDWDAIGDIPKYIPHEEKPDEEALPPAAEEEETAQAPIA